MPAIEWNASLYDDKHAFVSKYGEDLVGWLAPQQGERILDLGCGTGQLAAEIAGYGATVVGMDSSGSMIAKARKSYPASSHAALSFDVKDATSFKYDEPFDAIFSNAALHWVSDQENAVACMARNLKPGGRLVLEMGGKGNVQHIAAAVEAATDEAGLGDRFSNDFWFFPTIGEYASLLEQYGFRVATALHFDRETKLEGEQGMENWIDMFGAFFLRQLTVTEAAAVTKRAVELLKPADYRNGIWYADYKRLRIKAVKK